MQETQVWSLDWEDPLEKEMAVPPISLTGKSHGQRSLVGYSAWCYKEQDMTEHTCMLCYTGRELRERENIFFLNKNLTTQPI